MVFRQRTTERQLPEFYQVNLAQLRKATDIVQKRATKIIRVDANSFEVRASGNRNSYLYLSIPDSHNWSVKNNGIRSRHRNIYGIFLQIPLHKGNNRLLLTYHNPGVITGIAMTVISICIIILQFFYYQRSENKK